MFRRISITVSMIALVALAVAPAVSDAPAGKNPIFPLAKKSGLTTLATALQTAELVGTINGGGPYTVFAPTNEAFAALGEETLNAVLADKALLTDILLYHVAVGELLAGEVLSRGTIEMINGQMVDIDAAMVKVNGANIIATNVMAKNGVVHVIDAVLLPPSLTESASSSKAAKPGNAALFNLSGTAGSDSNTETKSWGAVKSNYSR